MSKRVLGRGLNTLLPSRSQTPAEPTPAQPVPQGPAAVAPVTELPVAHIDPNPFQPRRNFAPEQLEELAQSIRADGVIQPLIVRPAGDRYQLIAGERRWRASQLAGLETVPVRVQHLPDDRMLEVALIENIQREDLDPIESALAFQRLHEELALNHEEIGRRTGKDRATITNSIRLLQLSEPVQTLLSERKLSPGHARALLRLNTVAEQERLAYRVIREHWSVREIEHETARVYKAANQPPTPAAAPKVDPNVRAAIFELERVLGTKVRIVQSGIRKGRLEIDFYSPEDLDRIYAAIVGDRESPEAPA